MINLNRPQEIPESLQHPKIQEYLDALALCREDNGMPSPKAPSGFRDLDIIQVFETAFYTKCYLTEQKYVSAAEMEIDHFRTVNEAPELKYTWSNLFPISPLANRMRLKTTPTDGYLDPCADSDDVEREIVYDLSNQGQEISFAPRNPENLKAKNTAMLLERIHNGHDPKTHAAVQGLKSAIRARYTRLAELIISYLAANDGVEKARVASRIQKALSRESDFTMLLRGTAIVRRHVAHLIPD